MRGFTFTFLGWGKLYNFYMEKWNHLKTDKNSELTAKAENSRGYKQFFCKMIFVMMSLSIATHCSSVFCHISHVFQNYEITQSKCQLEGGWSLGPSRKFLLSYPLHSHFFCIMWLFNFLHNVLQRLTIFLQEGKAFFEVAGSLFSAFIVKAIKPLQVLFEMCQNNVLLF